MGGKGEGSAHSPGGVSEVTGPSAVVVPLDGSELAECAIRVAVPLGERLGSTVVLMTTDRGDDRRDSERYLAGLVASRSAGAFETVVVHDRDPAAAIASVTQQTPGRIVCMTTHGRGRARRALLGSVAESVLAASLDPVILVGRRCESAWLEEGSGIVVGVDGSPAAALATAAACRWAALLGLDVWLVFAIHPLDVEGAGHSARVLEPLADQVRANGLRVHPVVVRGSFTAGAFVDVAEDVPATMVVTATSARSGASRAVLGSFTMGTVGMSKCPVLGVPPSHDAQPN